MPTKKAQEDKSQPKGFEVAKITGTTVTGDELGVDEAPVDTPPVQKVKYTDKTDLIHKELLGGILVELRLLTKYYAMNFNVDKLEHLANRQQIINDLGLQNLVKNPH